MDTQNTKETKEPIEKTRRRPKKFYAWVKHRQISLETNQTLPPELLEFDTKPALRETLGSPQYEGCSIRVIRGHELNASVRHQVTVN